MPKLLTTLKTSTETYQTGTQRNATCNTQLHFLKSFPSVSFSYLNSQGHNTSTLSLSFSHNSPIVFYIHSTIKNPKCGGATKRKTILLQTFEWNPCLLIYLHWWIWLSNFKEICRTSLLILLKARACCMKSATDTCSWVCPSLVL